MYMYPLIQKMSEFSPKHAMNVVLGVTFEISYGKALSFQSVPCP